MLRLGGVVGSEATGSEAAEGSPVRRGRRYGMRTTGTGLREPLDQLPCLRGGASVDEGAVP
ncbi:hypothetical protein B0T36_02945 [Nocardia donostiensis]|nr:hypothetical protein B0T36_02945 [Nocardia donostiensis]